MKNLNLPLSVAAFFLAGSTLFAQSTLSTTTIEKESRDAVMITINQPAEIAEEALEKRMKRAGLSGKSHGDITVYKAVIFSELSPEKVDVYTKVEKGKDKNSCIVYMAVSKGYENFSKPGTDKAIFENMKTVLNSFVKDVSAYALDLQISRQEDEVKKDEKQYGKLVEDEKDLQKDKVDIEKNIVDKQKEIKDKKAELERNKQLLDKLKGQRSDL